MNKSYPKFKQINGNHDFKEAVPGAYIDYKARVRHGGCIKFFNFHLAKEMGLIPKKHSDKMNKTLEKSLLDTFSIVIINEYDEIHQKVFPKKDIKPNKYMATRYLQLQHPSAKGTTSGDGRSVWNGQVTNKGKTWDISSCGTGATSLSPASAKQNKFFETGDPGVSYGCGYCETDEGLGTTFFSEVLHKNNVLTERVLAIIEFPKGLAITVRAYDNLLRPSHFFNHLKQENFDNVKKVTDYYIKRQIDNKSWPDAPKTNAKKYSYFLSKIVDNFAKITAQFEDEYIFCWLDWDGDNILVDGGIIDYGSIRQFGLYHHEYRYDDVDRYSTSIKEQKQKSKYMVQTFAQMIDFLLTKKKKNIKLFAKDNALKEFEIAYNRYKKLNLLRKMGVSNEESLLLLSSKKLTSFQESFYYFEETKSKKGIHPVADGITCDAIFCMRDILREIPQFFLNKFKPISNDDFIQVMKSSYAKKKDCLITSYREKKIAQFQKSYMDLVNMLAKKTDQTRNHVLSEMALRSSIINKYDRITGDSVSHVVDKVLHSKPKLTSDEIYRILLEFCAYQTVDVEKDPNHIKLKEREKHIMYDIIKIVCENREGI